MHANVIRNVMAFIFLISVLCHCSFHANMVSKEQSVTSELDYCMINLSKAYTSTHKLAMSFMFFCWHRGQLFQCTIYNIPYKIKYTGVLFSQLLNNIYTHIRKFVITSYSIHYTKLYDLVCCITVFCSIVMIKLGLLNTKVNR